MNADDFDTGATLLAEHRRGGYIGLTRDDVEFLIILGRRQPFRESRQCLVRADVPALGNRVPLGAQQLHLGFLFRWDEKVCSIHGQSQRLLLGFSSTSAVLNSS